MSNKMTAEDVADFVERQLMEWPLAKRNYDDLSKVRRRNVDIGDLHMGIQWNPGRIVSTGAKTDSFSIKERACFLCRGNRPEQQMTYDILPGWELLVNPYPILPIHLTIASASHTPQTNVPDEIVTLAEMLPGMAVFFNGAEAGASAPDHLHLQAVLKDELPLLRLAERLHPDMEPGLRSSHDLGVRVPYLFLSGVVSPDDSGLRTLLAGLMLGGLAEDGRLTDRKLVNIFFWTDDNGLLRYVAVPRKAHRPSCFYASDDSHRLISPGCIDMAGLLIAPRESDYLRLTASEIETILSEVGV